MNIDQHLSIKVRVTGYTDGRGVLVGVDTETGNVKGRE